MDQFFLLIMVLALSRAVPSCVSTSSASTYGVGTDDSDGPFRFPVLHKDHPSFSSWIQTSSDTLLPEPAATRDDVDIPRGDNAFFMSISLGTPAVSNPVTIDTGSSLSWVQCGHCGVRCHWQAGPGLGATATARATFNPLNSSTYRTVPCAAEACRAVHRSTTTAGVVNSACPLGQASPCLYRIRYPLGGYSVGYLGKEKLTLPNNLAVDGFIFGCGGDNLYGGLNAGVIGFGDEPHSFFNQVARRTTYRAFSYCFPSNHDNEGFLSVGPYARVERLTLTSLIGHGGAPPFYSSYAVQLLDVAVNGISLDVDPRVYSAAPTIIDSGTADTFVLAPVFRALDRAVTTAMLAKGYVRLRRRGASKVCFATTGDSVSWSDLPAVEMRFGASAALVLRMENLFYVDADESGICLTFRAPDVAGGRGVQVLGNRALRSFRVVFDVQERVFGFQSGAC